MKGLFNRPDGFAINLATQAAPQATQTHTRTLCIMLEYLLQIGIVWGLCMTYKLA